MRSGCTSTPVHPRVGGERSPDSSPAIKPTGSSPRGRGTPIHVVEQMHRAGSSPRGRGTQAEASPLLVQQRFIPAWAGNAGRARWASSGHPVHPRVGGERLLLHRIADDLGSSPRGRGTHGLGALGGEAQRFIPAWAGNATGVPPWARVISVHPRVGGERNGSAALGARDFGSSPRGRGTRGRALTRCGLTVHPRVGGERTSAATSDHRRAGSSPRWRGTRRRGPWSAS